LAEALKDKGLFADALVQMKQGHECGSKDPKWSLPTAQRIKAYERLVELATKLSSYLKGEATLDKFAEQIDLAEFCLNDKRAYGASARLYEQALQSKPDLADEKDSIWVDAARAAAMTGVGRDSDAPKLSEGERLHWRNQALAWLRADLARSVKQVETGAAKDRESVRVRLEQWRGFPELVGLRDPMAIAKLPEGEQKACLEFWAEVDRILVRAQGK
jgi:hypothetical protein